jgi:hypothetical protein
MIECDRVAELIAETYFNTVLHVFGLNGQIFVRRSIAGCLIDETINALTGAT